MTVSGESVTIPVSTWKTALQVLGALGFVALGLWMVGAFGSLPTNPVHSTGYMFVVGVLSIGFFGLCAIAGLVSLARRIARRGRCLVLDTEGFGYQPASGASGRFAWNEVSGLRVWRLRRTRFLCVDVVDASALLARQRQPQRWLMERSIKQVGAPVAVTSSQLSCSFEALCRTFEHFSGKTVERSGSGPH